MAMVVKKSQLHRTPDYRLKNDRWIQMAGKMGKMGKMTVMNSEMLMSWQWLQNDEVAFLKRRCQFALVAVAFFSCLD